MTKPDSPLILRRLLLFIGGILVAASVAAAVITSLGTGASAQLLRVRSLLAEGRLNEAEKLLDSLEPFSQSDLPATQGMRRDLGLIRERERKRAEEQASLTIARTAMEDGRLEDAARALEGAVGLDRGLAEEVGEALLDQVQQARREWDHEEARRLLDLAKRAYGEEDETALIEAEFLIEEAEHLDERSEQLLKLADNALLEGEFEQAEKALLDLRTGGFSPEARAEGEQRSAVLEAHREARDRAAVLVKLDQFLDQGQVSASRELLELHARVTGSREFDGRIAALRELEEAGGATSFLPVRNALRFLVKCQDKTGGFSLAGYRRLFPKDKAGGSWQTHYDLGITGLALLAFTAFRHLDVSGEFNGPAARCAKFLVMSVPRTGSVTGNHYNHAIVALALLERTLAIGKGRSRAEFKAAGLIINYLTRRAQLPDGGWRYTTRGMSDSSVTCWVMQALDAARRAGIVIHGDVPQRGMNYLESLTNAKGWTGYIRSGQVPNLTAATLLVRQIFPEEALEGSAEMSLTALLKYLKTPLDLSRKPATAGTAVTKLLQLWNNHYGWYYATYAFHRMGGNAWTTWGPLLANALSVSQLTTGELAGSWEPDPRWGKRGGRIYTTALNALSLEVYYR